MISDVAKRIIAEMCRLRLEMRNAQYGGPLPEARVREINDGAIAPVAIEDMLSVCPRDPDDWFEWYHQRKKPLSAISVL